MHKLSRKDTTVSAIADTCSKDCEGRAAKFFDSSRNIKSFCTVFTPEQDQTKKTHPSQTGLARLVVVVGDGCP
ncbi:hypothetical protein H5410_025544 [Solanum commersonii]|uniref:Uncharacterized protein n=1 Tax=Solanum commersonii TaxID=4109 RepID=A0A9J5YY90_SOLCO|nr:hypothetical protein H5410_025544 [Solanum commersonii]